MGYGTRCKKLAADRGHAFISLACDPDPAGVGCVCETTADCAAPVDWPGAYPTKAKTSRRA